MRMRRKTYFVDRDVQGALALRVVGYWVAALWGVFCVLAGFPIIVTWWFDFPNAPTSASLVYQTWIDFWPAMAASLLLLPFLVRDVVRLSNRFVGPFFRVQTALRALARGEIIAPINFRKGDFWCDVAEDVNQIATMLAANNGAPVEQDEQETQFDTAPNEPVAAVAEEQLVEV